MTIEEQINTEIATEELLKHVQDLCDGGYRIVQIGCGKFDDKFEINYSFEKDYCFENLRIKITEGTQIPSISDIYWGAFIYENEIHDLFGVKISGINIDYKGNLIQTSIKTPFNVQKVTKVKSDEKIQAEKKEEAE